jgi:predicted dehydrogenase
MRALVVGTGSIGRRHITNLLALRPGTQLTFLRDGGADDEYSRSLGATVVAGLESALASAPDLAIIANPSALHAAAIRGVLAARIPFYLEKPVVTDRPSWTALARQLDSVGPLPPNLIGCNLRFLSSLAQLREIVTSGSLGRIVRASFEAGQWLPDWRPLQDYRRSYSASRALGGGVIADLVHEIDAARWLLGDFDAVQSAAAHLSELEIGTEDTAVALLTRAGGPLVSISLDYVSRKPRREYRIVGDRGTAAWDLLRRELRVESAEAVSLRASEAHQFDVSQTYVAAIRELLDAMERGIATRCDLEDAMKTTDLMLKIRERSGI